MKTTKPTKALTRPPKPEASASQQTTPTEELDAARTYWLEIERVTKGRYLHGTELAIAKAAWKSYVGELKSARDRALKHPKTLIPDPGNPPLPASIPEITPSQLAQIATRLAAHCHNEFKAPEPKSFSQARELLFEEHVPRFFPQARELLIQAASYLTDLSSKQVGVIMFEDSGVSFDEILESNEESNERTLKLLPGFRGGQAKGAERYKGLANFIRRYYAQCDPSDTDVAESFISKAESLVRKGESFIRNRFLPTKELVKLRAWHFRQQRTHGLKTARKRVNKIGLPKSGISPKKAE